LHAGGAGYRDGFVGLHLGLEPWRKKNQYPPGQVRRAGSFEIVL
jgi:hypothetical protein